MSPLRKLGMFWRRELAENVWMALLTLREHKLRSALTLLGIVVAVVTLITVVALLVGFDENIQQVIQGLIEQIIESITMMGVGQTITTALGAYTPLLVIAKNVVGVINDLLDALNLGL